jgi:hypothetical protein
MLTFNDIDVSTRLPLSHTWTLLKPQDSFTVSLKLPNSAAALSKISIDFVFTSVKDAFEINA